MLCRGINSFRLGPIFMHEFSDDIKLASKALRKVSCCENGEQRGTRPLKSTDFNSYESHCCGRAINPMEIMPK